VNHPTDQQLLRDYASRRSDAAFAELVRRHLDLVYSAALRMVCDAHLAQDVTQGAFVALAQNARRLAGHPVLSGWLHRTAQNLAANAVRSEVRRRAREQEAAAMNQLLAAGTDASWEAIAPHLDTALGELNETERDAVLLRYFERKSARDMAEILGTTEDTAQKRVNRAVERLRELFSRRNVTIGAGGLVVLISANAVQSAPTGLAATISSAAKLTATTLGMTMLHKILITGIAAAAVGTAIYAGHLRSQLQTLQQQQAALAVQIARLTLERDDASNQLAALRQQAAQTQADEMELLKLRGEVGRSRARQNVLPQTAPSKTNTPPQPEAVSILVGTKIVLFPAEDVQALGLEWTTDTDGNRVGLLTDQQYKTITEAMLGASDVQVVSLPRAVTTSGQRAVMSVTKAQALFSTNGTNDTVGVTYTNIGTILNILPSYSTNTSTFNLDYGAKMNVLSGDTTQPDIQTIEATNHLDLSPGQTAVMEMKIPTGNWLPDETNRPAGERSVLLFVTPQVVDSRGFQKAP
jgi:RNA polymerase sigma factor (sigma-70 family)